MGVVLFCIGVYSSNALFTHGCVDFMLGTVIAQHLYSTVLRLQVYTHTHTRKLYAGGQKWPPSPPSVSSIFATNLMISM